MFSKIARIVDHCWLLLPERYRLRSHNTFAVWISTFLIAAGMLALLIAIFAAAPLFAAVGDTPSVSRETLLHETHHRQSESVVHPAKEGLSLAMHLLNEAQAITLPPERRRAHE